MASVADWLLGHAVEIGCRYEAFDLWRPPDAEKGGRLRPATIPRQLKLLTRYVRWLRGSPSLIHYCLAGSILSLTRDVVFIALARSSGRTVIAHIHGSDLAGTRRRSVRSVILRLIARLSAERVAVAPRAAAALSALGVPARSIFNPVRFESNDRTIEPRPGPLRLLFVGAYGARKGCPELIHALAKARSRGADATLRLVGKEEQRDEEKVLRELVRKHGLDEDVHFVGLMPPDALRRCYEDADALCLPSKREQLPMVILEAMASGLPVIATPIGGIPDLVSDGETGLLVEPANVAALANAICSLSGDRARAVEMGAAARARVSDLAGSRAIARQWHLVYERYAPDRKV